MKPLPVYVADHWKISEAVYGLQRPPLAPVSEAMRALRHCESEPSNVHHWVELMVAALEGALRCPATAYSVSQALMNKQAELGARKYVNSQVMQFR
jgi:hypothetical protein